MELAIGHLRISTLNYYFHIGHKMFIVFILIMLGSALLDRDRILFLGERLSYGEIAFGIYLFLYILNNICFSPNIFNEIRIPNTGFSIYFIAFIAWTGLSWAINTLFIEGELNDFFGVTVRLAYYYIMALFVARWVKQFGPHLVVCSFCGGIFTMFVRNYYFTAQDLLTMPDAIPVTNFSGVLLPVSALYLALLYAYSPSMIILILMLVMYCSTVLIFSLGAYIFILTALPVVIIVSCHYFIPSSSKMIHKVFLAIFVFATGLFLSHKYVDEIELLSQNIAHKYDNISFTDAGSQRDQSMDYRIGQFQSSMKMTFENPLFGVGEFNWEAENDKNKDWMIAYHKNDNPHNAFAQIISMYGIPAFILFVLSVYTVFKRLLLLRLLTKWKWNIFVCSTALTFIVGANTMDSFFNTYYFYIFAGVIFGIGSSSKLPVRIT